MANRDEVTRDSRETILGSGKALSTVCAQAELEDDVMALLDDADAPSAFLHLLCETKRYEEAIAFLAHALPPREAVGWAWVCAREAMGGAVPPLVEASFEATRVWIKEPTDAVRRAAFRAADEAGMDTPAGYAGLAAFFSGDSLAPDGADPAPPPEGLAGRTVAGCVNLSAAWGDAEQVMARYEDFTRRGLELADRVRLWDVEMIAPRERPEA